MSTPVLDVRGLAFAYPDGHQALYGVDLHVHRGERVALLGPNGAGKTTLVLHLNGILAAGVGSVSVSGLPVTKQNIAEVRRRVGVVFQDPDDQLFMGSVHDDVAFGPANLGLRGEALERRVRDALDQVGMADFADRPPHHLSFGQRRRVAVATVLAMEPEILVLDEPSSNLDPASRRELAEILTVARRHRADGDPRPALRLRAVPAQRGALRRRDRGGRVDVRRADRRRADGRPPPGAAVRLRSPQHAAPCCRVTFADSRSRPHPRNNPGDTVATTAGRPETLESDIEATRERLAATIDQLAYRASPKTIVRREINGIKAHFVDAQGNPRTDNILKVAGGVVGFVAFVVVMRKVTK